MFLGFALFPNPVYPGFSGNPAHIRHGESFQVGSCNPQSFRTHALFRCLIILSLILLGF